MSLVFTTTTHRKRACSIRRTNEGFLQRTSVPSSIGLQPTLFLNRNNVLGHARLRFEHSFFLALHGKGEIPPYILHIYVEGRRFSHVLMRHKGKLGAPNKDGDEEENREEKDMQKVHLPLISVICQSRGTKSKTYIDRRHGLTHPSPPAPPPPTIPILSHAPRKKTQIFFSHLTLASTFLQCMLRRERRRCWLSQLRLMLMMSMLLIRLLLLLLGVS